MSDLTSFRAIIELWDERQALAAELPKVSATQVSKWYQRNSIPSEYWVELLNTNRAREAGITPDFLARLAARECIEARA